MKKVETEDNISVEKFHVSPLNVRAEEPFGEAEEDQLLIANLRQGKIIGPFKVRSENGGYGVFVGRRRFLAKKAAGGTHFVTGVDFLVDEMNDEEAIEASLTENLKVLRKTMNPITRAKALNNIVAHSPSGLNFTARRLGIPPSTLSEWIKVLELSTTLQEAMHTGLLSYTDGLKVARLNLGEALQDRLAEMLETSTVDAFRTELARLATNKRKRGIPLGVYEIIRVTWDKRNKDEMNYLETLSKTAEQTGKNVPEYVKGVLIRHVDDIMKKRIS